MPIEFFCQTCHSKLRTPDETAGKLVRCPKCGQLSRIPHDQFVGSIDEDVAKEPEQTDTQDASSAPQQIMPELPSTQPKYSPTLAPPTPANPYSARSSDRPESTYRLQPSGQHARQALIAPAWLMIAFSSIALLFASIGVLAFIVSLLDGRVRDDDMINLVMGLALGGLSLLSLFAGRAMIRQRYYSLAMIGAIGMVLWSICCCFLPLPIAIWSLVTLTRQDVKQQFR